ncbi:DNA cytosine methyltransferase [Paenibacillus sp. D51F]
MAALVASYSKEEVTSSYLSYPDHTNLWRPFTSEEISRILDIPDDFFFPEDIAETKRTYMLGNSVDCRVVKAIGIEAAFHLMMDRLAERHNPVSMRNKPSRSRTKGRGEAVVIAGQQRSVFIQHRGIETKLGEGAY